jgi:hypothetical protein
MPRLGVVYPGYFPIQRGFTPRRPSLGLVFPLQHVALPIVTALRILGFCVDASDRIDEVRAVAKTMTFPVGFVFARTVNLGTGASGVHRSVLRPIAQGC